MLEPHWQAVAERILAWLKERDWSIKIQQITPAWLETGECRFGRALDPALARFRSLGYDLVIYLVEIPHDRLCDP